jgi:hypothetical protein
MNQEPSATEPVAEQHHRTDGDDSSSNQFDHKLSAVDQSALAGSSPYFNYPWVEAIAITEATFEKIVLMLDDTPGIIVPAATATKPAIRAYSMRS